MGMTSVITLIHPHNQVSGEYPVNMNTKLPIPPPLSSTTAQELKTQQKNSPKVVVAINILCGHGRGQGHTSVSSTGLRPVNLQLMSHSFLQRSGSLARGLTCLSASWHSAKYLPDMSRTSSAITQYSVV